MTLADYIMLSRKRNRMTQEELGQRVDSNRASVSMWENQQRVPSLTQFSKLVSLFGWDAKVVMEVVRGLEV